MRVIVQRVAYARCTVSGQITGEIQKGFLLLVGFKHNDLLNDLKYCARKISGLRIFEDEQGKMNKSLIDVNGKILSISQFTLFADVKKGNRPSFTDSASFDVAKPLYDEFNQMLRDFGLEVYEGIFGADMKIELLNDGPVTILIDSAFA